MKEDRMAEFIIGWAFGIITMLLIYIYYFGEFDFLT